LAAVFLLAIAPRLAMLATTQSTEINTRWCPVCGDVSAYNDLAINILRTGTYQSRGQSVAERPPFYPAFLAAVYAIAGVENYGAVRLVQVILSAATVVVLSQFACRLFGPPAAWITGGLMSVYPFFLVFSVELYSETLFTFLLACSMWFVFPFEDRKPAGTIAQGALAGLLIGLTTLTRELGLFILPTVTLWHWISQKRLWSGGLLVLWLSAGAVIGVWTTRNYLVWQRFIPLTTHTFSNVIHGLVDDYGYYLDGASAPIPADVPPNTGSPYAWLGQHNQVEQEEYSRQLVISFCSLRPLTCATAWVRNLAKLVSPVIASRALWIVIIVAVIQSAVWLFGIAGLIMLIRERNYAVPLFLLTWFALCLSISAIAHVEIRYRIPIVDPYLMITASYALIRMISRRVKQSTP
jgi:4-amino-4-deoxy-L-arabinose transferase-like glycosyltransferase